MRERLCGPIWMVSAMDFWKYWMPISSVKISGSHVYRNLWANNPDDFQRAGPRILANTLIHRDDRSRAAPAGDTRRGLAIP